MDFLVLGMFSQATGTSLLHTSAEGFHLPLPAQCLWGTCYQLFLNPQLLSPILTLTSNEIKNKRVRMISELWKKWFKRNDVCPRCVPQTCPGLTPGGLCAKITAGNQAPCSRGRRRRSSSMSTSRHLPKRRGSISGNFWMKLQR